MQKTIDQILKYLFVGFVVIFPSFFLTNFVNVFDLPKITLLPTVLCIAIVLAALELATQGKYTFRVSNFDLPLLLLAAVYLVSAVIRTPNKFEAFVFPGNATIIISGFILYFFAKSAFKEGKNPLILSLFASGILVAILSIFAYLGIFNKIPQLPAFVKDPAFSPIGGKLPEVIFLVIILPLGAFLSLREKEVTKKIFFTLATLVMILAGVLSFSTLLPGKPTSPVLTDYQTSWSVAVDTLKVSPLWGVGPSNYVTAFSRFLPVGYNSSQYWAVRFSSGRSFLLTLITETGIFGFAAFALAIFVMLKGHLKNLKKISPELLSLLLAIVALVTFPANAPLIVLFFLLVYLNSESHEATLNLSATSVKNGGLFTSKIPSLILGLVLIAAVIVLIFFSGKALAAESSYKDAIVAINNNDAKTSYNALTRAIALNPNVDRYHATLDQLNLAIAQGIAQKKDITDTDKQTVTQLIQQAINEGKATVTLNQLRSANWELLARTYQSIMPFAQGADQFTIQTYTQAIALDPINPNLRIALGGVYYALGRYDDAINTFTLAVAAKSDLANAHYNLAIAYREKKDFDKAITEMNNVLSLVTKDSQDYTLAKQTLDDLEKNKPATPATGSANLKPPAPAQTSNIKPPIALPKEATPPATNQ